MSFSYLFRNTPDFFGSIFDTWYYYLLMVGFIAAIIFTLYIQKKDHGDKLLKVLAIILLAEQIVENIWFWTAPYLEDPLPLYHCRIAKIGLPLVVLFFRKYDGFKNFAISIGIFGSILAFAYPVMDPFKFPHFTNFGFFLTHMFIMLISLLLILEDKIIMDKQSIVKMELWMISFNIFDTIIANFAGKNYGSFLESPVLTDFLKNLPYGGYLLIIYSFYAIVVLMSAFIAKAVFKIRYGEKI